MYDLFKEDPLGYLLTTSELVTLSMKISEIPEKVRESTSLGPWRHSQGSLSLDFWNLENKDGKD
jgi:hypothetical protein